MMGKNEKIMQYSWITFYNILFDNICNNETSISLADKAYEIFGNKLLDKDENGKKFKFKELDPLTFIAMLNRQETLETKKEYFKKIINLFNLNIDLPEDVDGIPTFSNFTARFINHRTIKDPNTIQILWEFAKDINNNSDIDTELFNKIINLSSVKLAKLTQFLFIVRPDKYFPADNRSINYALMNLYIKWKPKNSFTSYKEYLNLLRQKCSDKPCVFSYKAFLYSFEGKKSLNLQDEINEYQLDILQNQKKTKELKPEKINQLLNSNSKPKLDTKSQNKAYCRNPLMRQAALQLNNYKCIFGEHKTFRTKTDQRYVEAHHIIPMQAQDLFADRGISLDVCQNIVALCPICHREIHHGENAKHLIEKLYNLRKKELQSKGIEITLEQLKAYY